VVLPTPPFWFKTAIIFLGMFIWHLLLCFQISRFTTKQPLVLTDS
jgi:hypothetical protein